MTCKQVAMPDSKLPQGKATVKGPSDGSTTTKKMKPRSEQKKGALQPPFPRRKTPRLLG